VRDGRKIQAIKAYREITGAGLKEAKEAVERMG
jgi:ribosomal protein L7/L12